MSDRRRPWGAHRATGIPMIRSIDIKNFRGFEEARLDDCRRFNIIVGENGSGKTGLLEGLFLAAGASPELAMRTRAWRGVDNERLSGSIEDINRALFVDLFHKFETNRSAVIALKGSGHLENRSVTIKFRPSGQMRALPPPRNNPGAGPRLVRDSPVTFDYLIEGRREFSASAEIKDNRVTFQSAPESIVKAVFFAANRVYSQEVVTRFSKLSRSFEEKRFLERFSWLYPNITNISVEVDASGPMLFATVNGLSEKLPLNLASGGMSKLAAILLAMPVQIGGIVIIDEIENGFYYKKLPLVWEAIVEFAREYNCQIFASTHSGECIDCVAQIAEKSPDEFSMIRTVLEDGEVQVRHFSGEQFSRAVMSNIEVR